MGSIESIRSGTIRVCCVMWLLVLSAASHGRSASVELYNTAKAALEQGDGASFQAGLKALGQPNHAPYGQCLSSILKGYAHMAAQDYGSAMQELTKAEPESSRLFGAFSPVHLDALTYLSWTYGYSGDVDEELRLCMVLLGHYQRDPERHLMEIADTYNTIAMNHGLRGDRYMEMRMAQQGLDMLQGHTVTDPYETARLASVRWTLLNSYALAAANIGQYASASMAAHECKRILAMLDPGSAQMSISDQIIARCWWLAERNLDSCLHYFDMAIDRLARNERPDQPGKGSAPWLSYTAFKADVQLQVGRAGEVLKVLEDAQQFMTPAHFAAPGYRESALKLLLTQAQTYLALGRTDQAQASAEKLKGQLEVARVGRNLLEFNWALIQLAIWEAQGEHKKAAALVDSVSSNGLLDIRTQEQRPAYGEGVSVVDVLARFGAYHLRRAHNDPKREVRERSLVRALELLEQAFQAHLEQQVALDAGSLFEQWSFGYMDPTEVLLQALHLRSLQEPAAATRAAEVLGRSKGLLLGNQRWLEEEYERVLPQAVEEERLRLRAAVFSASSSYASASSPEAAKALLVARAAYSKFIDDLEKTHPDLTRRAPAAACSLVEAARRHGAQVVDYYVGTEDLFIIRATETQVFFDKRDGVRQLKDLVIQHRTDALDPRQWTAGIDPEANSNVGLAAIRKLVWDGVLDLKVDHDRVIIVPHDVLFLLNFEVLPSATVQGGYLVEECTISHALGSSMLCQPPKARNPQLHAGVFSASNYAGLPTGSASPFAGTRGSFFDLAHTSREGEAIAKLFRGVHLRNSTTADFLGRVKEFDIVHIGAHGFGHPDGVTSSFLLFEGEDAWDSRVTGAQVAGMDLLAELVVLSACNTGVGGMLGPEGTASLARAFLQAGAGSVVAGLWQVPDESTSDLMVAFHGYLSQGMDRAEALRQAKLDHLRSNKGALREPFHWAGFVLYGEPGPVLHRPWYRSWWVLVLLIVAGGLLVYRFVIRSRSSTAS